MSDDLTPKTPREVRMCRDAFAEGVRYAAAPRDIRHYMQGADERRYPMPTVEVPRVVVDASGKQWRLISGLLQWREDAGFPWRDTDPAWCPTITVDRVLMLAQLLANPTERREVTE